MRRFAVLVLMGSLIPATHLVGDETSPAPGLRTFFAFEKEIWRHTDGARLLRTAIERPFDEPVLKRGAEGVDDHRIDFTSILPEGDKLRCWYGGITGQGPSFDLQNDICVAYAESEDGVTWIKPQLDIAEAGTNKLIQGVAYMTVAPAENGKKGYRGAVAYFKKNPGFTGATFELASSEDGYHWDFDRKPATDIPHFEAYGMFHRNKRWWVLGQGVPPHFHRMDDGIGYRLMYGFHSNDNEQFVHYPRPLFGYPAHAEFPDASLQHHVGAGVWDRDRVLIGIAGQFWPGGFSSSAGYSIGLLYSYDGVTWHEPFPQKPILGPDRSNDWEKGWVLQIQRPVSRNDETYFYYVGGDGGNEWTTHASVGLGKLRRDGFASQTAVEELATLVSVPLVLRPGETTLYVNATGTFKVQVLDEYLQPMGQPIYRDDVDNVRAPVADLVELRGLDALLANSPLCVSFELQPGARLYSFSLGPSADELTPLEAWE